jgi:hypothetical protein
VLLTEEGNGAYRIKKRERAITHVNRRSRINAITVGERKSPEELSQELVQHRL